MPRVRSGKVARRRHKKILKLSKGYIGSKGTLYKTAHEQVMRAHQNAYIDRKRRKRDFRKLWITRINAATRLHGLKYSRFMHGLTLAGITVNRKMLSEIAIHNPKDFEKYVEVAKDAIENPSKYVKEEKVVVKKEVKPAVKKEVKTEAKKVVDYSKLLVKDLKELAKEKEIDGYSTMLKAELVEALTKLDK